jgi:hypothetical protein
MPKNPFDTLNPEEKSALVAYAKEHGRTWKSSLRDDWYNASAESILHRLRNKEDFGPTGLINVRLPKEK